MYSKIIDSTVEALKNAENISKLDALKAEVILVLIQY